MKLVCPNSCSGLTLRRALRVVAAPNEDAAPKLAFKGFADEEIRLCIADTEPEGGPKKTEANRDAIRVSAAHGSPALGGCRPPAPLGRPRLHAHSALAHHHGVSLSAATLGASIVGAVPRPRTLVARNQPDLRQRRGITRSSQGQTEGRPESPEHTFRRLARF
jgi:hypothetical protein